MELPRRPPHDVYVPAGGYRRIVAELQQRTEVHNWSPLLISAFDERTRVMPFRWVDKRMVPCGVRSLAASLLECGFAKARIVLQQWNKNVRTSAVVRGGHAVDILMVSSMGLHAERAYELIRDAHKLGDDRPLILMGGPKAIYEPEDLFAPHLVGQGVDIAVTGEEYVVLELLKLLADQALPGQTPLQAFRRARRAGLLDNVPGLVYRAPDHEQDKPYLINTGVQRLLQNLDELPMPLAGYTVVETPHKRAMLDAQPMPAVNVRRKALVCTLVVTHGCRFNCDFCPIPAYQQRTWRHKSPERIAAEMKQLAEELGYKYFFGTDDNFFNNRESVEAIFTAMAATTVHGRPFHEKVRFMTEATEFDVYKNRDLLPLARRAGLFTLYFGIEDLNAKLINKGQTVGKTEDLFREMRENEIEPYAMMIHHDDQPFWSRNEKQLGVANQALKLYRMGALGYHTTYICPSPGARNFEKMFSEGTIFDTIGGEKITEAFFDGNHIVASRHRHAWIRQLQLWGAYFCFYNPLHMARAIFSDLRVRHNRKRLKWQIIGMSMIPTTIVKGIPYLWSLAFEKIQRYTQAPTRALPMVEASTGKAIRWGIDGTIPYEVQHEPLVVVPLRGDPRLRVIDGPGTVPAPHAPALVTLREKVA